MESNTIKKVSNCRKKGLSYFDSFFPLALKRVVAELAVSRIISPFQSGCGDTGAHGNGNSRGWAPPICSIWTTPDFSASSNVSHQSNASQKKKKKRKMLVWVEIFSICMNLHKHDDEHDGALLKLSDWSRKLTASPRQDIWWNEVYSAKLALTTLATIGVVGERF